MDPMQVTPAVQLGPSMQPIFAPGLFLSTQEGNDYLSSLDSDTRDYVMKHTDEFRTRDDIEECINRLHSKR